MLMPQKRGLAVEVAKGSAALESCSGGSGWSLAIRFMVVSKVGVKIPLL